MTSFANLSKSSAPVVTLQVKTFPGGGSPVGLLLALTRANAFNNLSKTSTSTTNQTKH